MLIAAYPFNSVVFAEVSPDADVETFEEEWDVQITADEIEYAREDEIINARGNVIIIYRDMVMTADRMSYSRDKAMVEAYGNIFFERDFFFVWSSSMIYNIETSTGRVFAARVVSKEILGEENEISTPPLIIEDESLELRGDDEFFIPRGKITTCDDDTPHYYFKGSSIYVKLEDRFSLRNALFVIRGVPVFYYPYYWRNLGEQKLIWHLDIGSSKIKGTFVRAGASYPFTENSRTGLGLEIMQRGGPGIYASHKYTTESGRTDFDVYYLAETHSRQGRVQAAGRQNLDDRLTLRYRGRYSSVRMIEQDYFREERYGVDSLYWLGGLDYAGAGYALSAYFDREDRWGLDRESYRLYRQTLPGFSGRIYPFNAGRRIIVQGSANYRRSYDRITDAHYSYVNWDSNLRRNFRLNMGRGTYASFSPGAGYDGSYAREETKHYGSVFTENRFVYRGFITFDTNYRYRAEMGYYDDPGTSLLGWRLTLRPWRPFRMTTRSSYDFIADKKPVGDFISEAEYIRGLMSIYLRNRYDYYDRYTKQWIGELSLGGFSRTTVRYDRPDHAADPKVLDVDQQLRFNMGPFDLIPALRFKTKDYYNFDEFTEQRLDILWDMHCWESRIRFRQRGDESEVWLLFNIKVFGENRIGLYGNFAPDIMDLRYHNE